MKAQRYAIVDLETTGGRASRDKITEIAIVLYDGQQIIDQYETLINPETYIPYGITQLTGITQEMVADAPKFYEVAKKIVEMTEGAVFVAHNVRFDYSFLRAEFSRLGFTYTRKQLCTVRLSRKVFPGLSSYGLDNLTTYFDIPVSQRHRAMGDAMATTTLLDIIFKEQHGDQNVKDIINLGIKEALLPKNLTLEKIHALPESCGVYYFHNEKGDVVYVGKSINIKKRVAEHFAQKTEKARKLQQHVHEVTYELTGSELIALLHESKEIKRLRPPINRAQRQRNFPYVVHTYHNDAGYRCFEVAKVTAKVRKDLQIVSQYPKSTNAKSHLASIVENFELCRRYTHLDAGTGACFHYHLKQCYGACLGQEPVEIYNERANQALERLSTVFDKDFFLLDEGRSTEEYAVVLVEEGLLQGFGYIDREGLNGDLNYLRDAVQYCEGNPETTRIIQRYMSKHPRLKVISF
jgi:DNA polymerase-3 subunit epsilon